jgi:hypothetical protein
MHYVVMFLLLVGCLGLVGCFPTNCAPIRSLGYVCPEVPGKGSHAP